MQIINLSRIALSLDCNPELQKLQFCFCCGENLRFNAFTIQQKNKILALHFSFDLYGHLKKLDEGWQTIYNKGCQGWDNGYKLIDPPSMMKEIIRLTKNVNGRIKIWLQCVNTTQPREKRNDICISWITLIQKKF